MGQALSFSPSTFFKRLMTIKNNPLDAGNVAFRLWVIKDDWGAPPLNLPLKGRGRVALVFSTQITMN